jgi:HD superfamily phosphodiesterase
MEPFTEIEKICEKQLDKNLDADLWPAYALARAKVFKDLLPYIRRNEPYLSDHGPDHIINVLNNAYALLGRERCAGKDSTLSLEPTELYFLVLSILFHDVGNVFTRKNHNSRLQEAYEFARGNDQSLLSEKQILFKIVEAHGGKTSQGSPDTISPLDRRSVFRGKRVDCQRIAAILRLADELAEGQQRTSLFMQEHIPYPEDSQVFHDYASICDVHDASCLGRRILRRQAKKTT